MIEVVIQDGIAITGDIELGEGLAFRCAEQRKKLILGNRIVTHDVKGTHQSLRSFLNLHDDA